MLNYGVACSSPRYFSWTLHDTISDNRPSTSQLRSEDRDRVIRRGDVNSIMRTEKVKIGISSGPREYCP